MLEKRQRASEEESSTRRAPATTRTTEREDNTRTTARSTAPAATTSARGAASSAPSSAAGRSSAPSSAGRGVSTPSVGGTPSASLPNSAASASSSAAAKSGSSNTGVIIAVVVVAIACLAAMAAFVILRRKKRSKAAALASRAEKAKSEEMFGHGPGDMAAVADYRNRVGANDPYGSPMAQKGFNQSPYSPNEKGSRRSWEQSDDGRSYGNHSEVGLVGAAAFPGKGRHPSSQPSDNSYGSEPYSPPPPPVPSIDPAIAAMQAVGVNQNGPANGGRAEGSVFIVKRMFEPSLSDELIIYPGDRVRILNIYDDGWCLSENLTSAAPGQAPPRGVCPRDCIDNAPLSAAELASSPTGPAGGSDRVSMPQPSLAPLQTDGGRAPAIQVSSPTGSQENNYNAIKDGQTRVLTPTSSSKAPQLPGQPKRHSSLLASRDAELFMALGEVLEKDGQPRR